MMDLPPELRGEGLYDADGRHLGGIYEPLAIGGRLTGAHAMLCAARPAERLLWDNTRCQNPTVQLGLVYMISEPNPLATAPGALGYVVEALDAGQSVKLHAVDGEAIRLVCEAAGRMVGGGRA